MQVRKDLRNPDIHSYQDVYVFQFLVPGFVLMSCQEGLLRTQTDRRGVGAGDGIIRQDVHSVDWRLLLCD